LHSNLGSIALGAERLSGFNFRAAFGTGMVHNRKVTVANRELQPKRSGRPKAVPVKKSVQS